jgi:hypothetical protein
MIKWAKLDEEDIVVEIIEETDESDNEGPLAIGTESANVDRSGWVRALDDGPAGTYAAPGFKYDRKLKKFVPPKPSEEDELDLKTMRWIPPMPKDGKEYLWDRSLSLWVPSE